MESGLRRQSLKGERVKRVCIPIIETEPRKILKAIGEANRLGDLIELRLDFYREVDLERFISSTRKPVIVTNRPGREGGRYRGDEWKRLEALKKAMEIGTDYIDLEANIETSHLKEVLRGKRGSRIILSYHDFRSTPSWEVLKGLFDRMSQLGADLLKIVTFARTWEDNLNILSLLSYGRRRRRKTIAFCMGEMGKMSRIFSPLMGGEWTYASLTRSKNSAPGQLTVMDLREIWRRLK